MADYDVAPDKLLEGIKGLAPEVLEAIKVALGGDDDKTPVKIKTLQKCLHVYAFVVFLSQPNGSYTLYVFTFWSI